MERQNDGGPRTFSMGFHYPDGLVTLRALVAELRYKPGWTFGFKAVRDVR